MKDIIKVVIALGGNALQKNGTQATAEEQLKVVKKTCEKLANISCKGYEIAIVHGNGPQVGRILLSSEYSKEITPQMPFDVCGAMSQGYIGYHIQQGLKQTLRERGRNIPVATIVTQVVVNKLDPAFQNPTKPIGPFYSKIEAAELSKEKKYTVKEDAGRGWRRVVPSPLPEKIVEIDTIEKLWDSTILITCGGGGIPVIETDNYGYEGIAAVIDKDFAAEKLAEDIDADILMILTEVEKVSINFNKPNQEDLLQINCEEANKYISEGHFAPGSMLPKVTAAVAFAKSKPGRKSIITSLFKSEEALEGKNGTIIEM